MVKFVIRSTKILTFFGLWSFHFVFAPSFLRYSLTSVRLSGFLIFDKNVLVKPKFSLFQQSNIFLCILMPTTLIFSIFEHKPECQLHLSLTFDNVKNSTAFLKQKSRVRTVHIEVKDCLSAILRLTVHQEVLAHFWYFTRMIFINSS